MDMSGFLEDEKTEVCMEYLRCNACITGGRSAASAIRTNAIVRLNIYSF